jgi:membrane fusion protein (multidrug efflux system)
VVDAGNQVAVRQITTAQAIGDKWLVTAGLKAGDRLIVDGVDKAKAGATVKPVAVTLTKSAGGAN